MIKTETLGDVVKKLKIKPYPFCGDKTPIIDEVESHVFEIQCHSCSASLGYFQTKEDAVKAWNKRQVRRLKDA